MSSIRKLVMMLGVLLASSSVLMSCSDDDDGMMGAVPVNSVVATSSTVDVVWSIVPNDNCAGYIVSLLQGSRDGAVIETKEFDNRTCKGQFTGLQPNTEYCIKTQAKPGAGFNSADVYYREFTTSPIIDVNIVSYDAYNVNGYDSDGNPTVTKYYTINMDWPAIAESNCGGYYVAVFNCKKADWKANAAKTGQVTISKDDHGVIATSASIKGLESGKTYTIGAYARPNSMCDYTQGDWSLTEITTPQ